MLLCRAQHLQDLNFPMLQGVRKMLDRDAAGSVDEGREGKGRRGKERDWNKLGMLSSKVDIA